MRGVKDSPHDNVKVEKLGLVKEIRALSRFILNCETPMTIAIQGDWGTGKTSMMLMIKQFIQTKCECVWFNTWQFSQFQMQDDVPLALLAQLLEQVIGEKSKLAEFFSGFMKNLKDATVAVADVAAGVTGVSKAVGSIFQERVVGQATQLKQLKEKLENVIKERLVKTGKTRLVVFVDDLDRMNPGKAVELMEVIKIFLDLPGCVFVLAVDYGVVSRGVREKYGADMDEMKGRSFFDKIIQLPFNLPVARYTIEAYLKDLMNIEDDYVKSFNKLAKASVGTNPRTLKRMANILELLEIIEQEDEDKKEITQSRRQMMFAALCLQMAFETVYAQILSEGIKMNLVEAKSDAIVATFSPALDKVPGVKTDPQKKEELKKKLSNFFNTLNEVLSDMGEEGWQQFSDVLRKSGITASGSQQPFMPSEPVSGTFDPALIGLYSRLPGEIMEKYKDYFSMLQFPPSINEEKPNYLDIPAIFGDPILFAIHLEKDGIEIFFWCEEKADIKNCYKSCLQEAGVEFPAELTIKKGSAKAFMTLPTIPWKVPVERMDKASSQARFEQARDIIFRWCDALLPPMQKFYKPKAEVIQRIASLLDRLEAAFRSALPEERGWVYTRGEIGTSLYPDWVSLSFRKSDWEDGYEVELLTDELFSNAMNIVITQPYNEAYAKKPKATAFFKAWKKTMGDIPDIDQEDGIGRNENFCAFVVFPEELGNWTEGSFEDDDFAYALNDEHEKGVLAICQKCAEVIAANEELIDSIAARK